MIRTFKDDISAILGGAVLLFCGVIIRSATAMCNDDQVTKVSRITASTEQKHGFPPRKSERRLKDTVSEAVIAHRVPDLISGLKELGCQRTTGEDQTLCIMSDSFNTLGEQLSLQESGDLPPDEFLTIVEELPSEFGTGLDEGSAMMELAYDIASGANFKFSTMVVGNVYQTGMPKAAADDIIKLGTDEACDIIVDDIFQDGEPGFRDGIISEAVDNFVAAGSLYFSSAGNYRNGYKFTSNWECTSDLFGGVTADPCDDGVTSHVFHPNATGIDRYRLRLDGARFSSTNHSFLLHWDDDEGTSRIGSIELWVVEVDPETGDEVLVTRSEGFSAFGTAILGFTLLEDFVVGDLYYITISQHYSDLEDVEMRLMSRTADLFSDFSDGSIFAHKCAASTISVAAFNSWDVSGVDGAFSDPEKGSVAEYSSRGPCYINSGNGLKNRLKPVTTAATALQTSTNPERFANFTGTSASAPVAAAIATIVRAACFPRVVTYSDMIEMLSSYTYTIDVPSDNSGEEEKWGTEAGHGIISAHQMLGWIAANCQESCPGAGPSPDVKPNPASSTSPSPVPPSTLPVPLPLKPPTYSPISSPSPQPTALPMGGLMEVGEKTLVSVTAYGCSPNECTANNTRDGDLSSMWSCKNDLLDDKNCEITYAFEEPQDIDRMRIAFYKDDERIRTLNVNPNGSVSRMIESSGKTDDFEEFELNTHETDTLTLESLGLREGE